MGGILQKVSGLKPLTTPLCEGDARLLWTLQPDGLATAVHDHDNEGPKPPVTVQCDAHLALHEKCELMSGMHAQALRKTQASQIFWSRSGAVVAGVPHSLPLGEILTGP